MMFSEVMAMANNLAACFAGLGIGVYAMWRKMKRVTKEDSLDVRFTKQIDALQSQLTFEREDKARLGSVIDALSAERNEAVREVGKLEGTVEALKGEVERLSGEVRRLEEINKQQAAEMNRMASELLSLTKQIGLLAEQHRADV